MNPWREYTRRMKRRRDTRNDEKKAQTTVTSIHLPTDLLSLLRRLSVERSVQNGTRNSVSAVILELLEQHRDELQAEYEKLLKTR